MVALGFFTYKGGLRFTVFAVPFFALGNAYIAYIVAKVSKSYFNEKVSQKAFYGISLFLMLGFIYPNYAHVHKYITPSVFNSSEVKVLDTLKKVSKRDDYVLSWWDYGYPIRYYADLKTLSDGGKHSGSVNFPTSFILTHSQIEASKMLRLDVEYTESKYNMKEEDKDRNRTNIANMTLDYGYKDTNNFLTSLGTDIQLPKKTRDVYLYLPNRMINIYPTVNLFSNIDLMTGIKGKQPFFYKSTNFKESKDFIDLGRGIKIEKQTGKIIVGNQKVSLKRFVKTAYLKNGKLQKQVQTINPSANLNVIFMSNYKQFLVVENSVFNSLYFQLFVFENYDKELFEPIILTPLAKVYKLKK
jgi:dolichyl-diphosphooligosaccharide--protein glycosyltransferase/undecaprenyl-diphosphooligosaccharide--protein glycosyltransferase